MISESDMLSIMFSDSDSFYFGAFETVELDVLFFTSWFTVDWFFSYYILSFYA